MRGLTVYVDGDAKEIDLGRGKSGGVFPSAVLDSGVPVILTSTSIANGIYGALGIGPASDGNCESVFYSFFSAEARVVRVEMMLTDRVRWW